jgi:NAD+ diphosphatase
VSDSASVPTLSRTAVDRAAQRRDDEAWLAGAWQSGRLLVLDDDYRATVDDDGPALVFVDSGSWSGDGVRLLLGVDDEDRAYWGTVGQPPARLGTRPGELRMIGTALNDADAGLFVTAVALINWHAANRHCPRCGAEAAVSQAGWSRLCPVDGSQIFPRTDPAIIVLLHDGADRALLGRQPSWPPGRYSTIAGFVEAGESAEQCVHREVLEETGVTIDGLVYRGSQPWPFPQSLMLGYEATVTGGVATAADQELEDVRWFTRDELKTGPSSMPANSSIAYWLISGWLDRG